MSTSTDSLRRGAVWDIADKVLRNVVEEEEYGDYILPFAILRRLECLLAETKADVLAFTEGRDKSKLLDMQIATKFKLHYYCTSPFTLEAVCGDSGNILESFTRYIEGFSSSIADIWTSFAILDKAKVLDNAGRLFAMCKQFALIDLHPDRVDDLVMGDIFEDLMYRAFSEKGKGAGAFYTPRDAIRMMVDILFASDDDGLRNPHASRSIYDPTAGTGGMLLIAHRALRELNPDIDLSLYGQELMASTHAIGKADLLMISGGRPDSIRFGDTLLKDEYEGQQFDYILSNPPFGVDWSHQKAKVEEQGKVEGSRFSHGLPATSDGQMLFLCHVASKLARPSGATAGGRGAVVTNGSPLFTGGPGSGPDRIRAWLLESDLVDAIIALPNDIFYGTGISTYVWILDTNKEPRRQGKVQLIDATGLWHPMQKGMGYKRRELDESDRQVILAEYAAFEDSPRSRVMDIEELGYIDIPVLRQRRLRTQVDETTLAALRELEGTGPEHEAAARAVADVAWNDLPLALKAAAKLHGAKMTAAIIDRIALAIGVDDPDAPPAVDRKGRPLAVPGSKMVERLPLTEDLEDHMAREVLPFAPDAIWLTEEQKIGYEIPFTRIFFEPEPVRSLEEIDADVADVMRSLAAKFEAVRK